MDLPVWQSLFDSLADANFMVVAVAMDSRGAEAARPWIEAAAPTYWSLIDPEHRVASLYGMVNVPQAVWIDERGKIVRPPESAGSTDHFRGMDQVTKTLAPDDAKARLAARTAYMDAVRAWVRTDAHSLPGDAARAALPALTADMAMAHAHFRLGVWLQRHNRVAEAARHLAEASRLHPESWNMWRQTADLEQVGKSGGPEFWARVRALGDKSYYPPPNLPGFAAD